MSLDLNDLSKIANLARLELPEDKSEQFLAQINGFFEIVASMQAVDTKGVAPLAQPTAVMQELALRLNPDEVLESNDRERNQQNAPAIENGLFLVPRVIE